MPLSGKIIIGRQPLDSCFYYFAAIQNRSGRLGNPAVSGDWKEQSLGTMVFLLKKDNDRAKKVLLYLRKILEKTDALNYSPARNTDERSPDIRQPDPEIVGKMWYIIAVMRYAAVTGDRSFSVGAQNLGYKIVQYLLASGGLVTFGKEGNSRISFRDNLLAIATMNSLSRENGYFRQVARRLKYFVDNYFNLQEVSASDKIFAFLAGEKPAIIPEISEKDFLNRAILAIVDREKKDPDLLEKNLIVSPDYPGTMGLPSSGDNPTEISLIATAFYIFSREGFNPLATVGTDKPADEKISLGENFDLDDFETPAWQLPLLWLAETGNCRLFVRQDDKEHYSGEHSLAMDFSADGPGAVATLWRNFLNDQNFSGYSNISFWLKARPVSLTPGSQLSVRLVLANKQGREFVSRPLVMGASDGFVNIVPLASGLELSESVKDLALRQIKKIGWRITESENNNWKIYLDNIILK